jgi:tetratricopeptide (TPR) repeat protein
LNNAAFLLARQQRWAEAVPLYRKSVDLARRSLGPDHDRVLTFQQNLAGALAFSGEPDEALRVLNERLASTQRLWPNGHWRIGSAHQGIGKLLLQMERHADAEAAFRSAVASFHATIGPVNTWVARCGDMGRDGDDAAKRRARRPSCSTGQSFGSTARRWTGTPARTLAGSRAVSKGSG